MRLEVWKACQRHSDEGVSEELVKQYLPLVRKQVACVKPLLPRSIDEADIVGYGLLGLLEAITRYDAQKGVPFEAYAMTRIRGAIIDGLRAMGWMPRSAYRKAKQFRETIKQLEEKLGKAPTEEEITTKLGMSMEELCEFTSEAACVLLLPWEEMSRLAENSERERSAEKAEMDELREALSKAVDELPEKERLIITLYFYEQITLSEIAKLLNITEGRACQLKTQALLRLRAALRHAE